MSKRNRHRLPDNVQDGQTDSALPKLNVVVDPNEDEKETSFLHKTGTFFTGCWDKIASFSKSAASKTWSWCKFAAQGTWNALKKIPSYCVIRSDAEEQDEIDDLPDVPVKSEPVKTVAKSEPVKTAPVKVEHVKTKVASAKTDYDEDELAPSRWWNLGIKSAAIAAAVLVLAGGYFGIKSFFTTPTEEVAETSDTEIVELINQEIASTSPVAAPEPIIVEPPAVTAAPVAMAFEPAPPVEQTADGRRQTADGRRQTADGRRQTADVAVVPSAVVADSGQNTMPEPTPAPESPQNNPPEEFPVVPQAPVVAESAPPVANDAFAVIQPPIEPPAPVVAETAQPPVPLLADLHPLPPMQVAPTVSQPSPLPPLVALHSSALPVTGLESPPTPLPATVYAPIANNYARSGGSSGVAFQQTPASPSVTALPPSIVERSIVVAPSVPEIIPQIPHSGTVQYVPPPIEQTVASSQQTVANVTESAPSVEQFMKNSESAPAIPKDAPIVESPIVVPAGAPMSDVPPIDRQLWEHVHEIRNRIEEPMQVRLDETASTTVPALRFTPKPDSPDTSNLLTQEAMNSFQDLRTAVQLSPADLQDIETALSALENDAPQPVWAQTAPAYRNDSTEQTNSEGGQTFQSRIDSAISRSPQETETYIVRQGDTYMTISDRFYGTSLLYNALAQHNLRLGIGWRPAEGVVIEIPTAEYLRMHYSESTNQQERRLDPQRSAVPYIVQEGDTVFRLATDRLQDSTRWREIYAMNSDQLRDIRDLKPGMTILLPIQTARRN